MKRHQIVKSSVIVERNTFWCRGQRTVWSWIWSCMSEHACLLETRFLLPSGLSLKFHRCAMSFNVLYAPNSSGNICNYLSILDVQIPWKNFVGQKLLLPPLPPSKTKLVGAVAPTAPTLLLPLWRAILKRVGPRSCFLRKLNKLAKYTLRMLRQINYLSFVQSTSWR